MKDPRLRFILLTVLITVSFFFLIERTVLPQLSTRSSDTKDYRILGMAINLVRDNYVREPSAKLTMRGAFRGFVDGLDVLSAYLDKAEVDKLLELDKADYMDIGVVLYKTGDSFPQVIGLREGSPAEARGIKLGDIITAIDNRSTLGMSMREATLYLKDRSSKPVNLRLLRPERPEEITVERQSLDKGRFTLLPAAKTSGILAIHRLTPPCVGKIEEEIVPRLRGQNSPLVLDLRNCCEGDVNEARDLINLFLKAETIGSFNKKDLQSESLSCPQDPPLPQVPLVVWTNSGTMGPAEIVAAVLKKFGRARVVGLKTPGLTARQKLFLLGDGSGLLLTTDIFTLPGGEKVWQEGIPPDERVDAQTQETSAYLAVTEKLTHNK